MDMVCITSTHAWNEFSASVILSIASNASDNTYCNENNSVVAQTQQSGLLTLLKLIDVYQSKSQNCRLIMNWIIILRLPDQTDSASTVHLHIFSFIINKLIENI